MTRLGWTILAAILLVAGGFLSLMSFGTGGGEGPRPVSGPEPEAGAGGLVVPVAGVSRDTLQDTWGAARDGGARPHEGIDIAAPRGTPVLAAAAGRVDKLFDSQAGGHTIYVRSGDGRWRYYYAHLAGYAADLREGQTVRAGEPIGYVGDSGNAGAGNTHLHFGIARTDPAGGWWQGRAVNPYPMLAGRGADR